MQGIYCLLVEVTRDMTAPIGALGEVAFAKGLYGYVGSAQGGLEQRLARHFSAHKTRRWHIDYLLAHPAARPIGAYVREAGRAEECRLAATLAATQAPVVRFGCSDCRCLSHLYRLDKPDRLLQLGLRKLTIVQNKKNVARSR